MSKETREHISRLVDGEISRETSRFLVRRLGTDNELRATWTRYHLIRDCLRHQDGAIAGEDLCARINRALENEQPGHASRRLPTGWLKPAAGLAIAASVALMAVVAVGPGVPGASQNADGLADVVPVEQFTSPQSLTPAPNSSQASLAGRSDAMGREMDSYLVRHYQAAGTTGGRGFVTFVPIVITGAKPSSGTDDVSDAEDPEAGKDEETRLQ